MPSLVRVKPWASDPTGCVASGSVLSTAPAWGGVGMEATVSIRGQDGTAEDRAWASATAQSIESSAPWRTFRWYMGQKHYSGTYWSATVGDLVIYESRLELARLLFADFDASVRGIVAQPFLLKTVVEGKVLASPAVVVGQSRLDLADTDTLRLDADHPTLAAQALLLDVIEKGTAAFGAYTLAPQPALAALADIRAICGRALSCLPGQDIAQWVPAEIAAAHLHPEPGCTLAARAEQRPGFMSPPRAVTAATAVAAALHVLNQSDIHRAGAALRPLLEAIRGDEAQVRPTTIQQWGRGVSPVLAAVHLAGLAPSCRPSDHLRHRLSTEMPRFPARTKADISLRGRKIPSMFWDLWAVRLSPTEGTYARVLAPALAASILLVDSRSDFDAATRRLGNVIDGHDLSRVLQRLDNHPGWADLVTALVRLTDHLDAVDVPINYARRRGLDYSNLLPAEHWAAICRRTDTPPGGGLHQQIMRCYLFQQISGLPIEAAPGYPGTNGRAFRSEYARRTTLRTPELAQALQEEATAFLASRRIDDEPVTWQPPISLTDGLNLPGPDPDRVDIRLLHKLVRQREQPAQRIAAILDTSVEAIRHLLDLHPAPANPETEAQARATGRALSLAPPPEEAQVGSVTS